MKEEETEQEKAHSSSRQINRQMKKQRSVHETAAWLLYRVLYIFLCGGGDGETVAMAAVDHVAAGALATFTTIQCVVDNACTDKPVFCVSFHLNLRVLGAVYASTLYYCEYLHTCAFWVCSLVHVICLLLWCVVGAKEWWAYTFATVFWLVTYAEVL